MTIHPLQTSFFSGDDAVENFASLEVAPQGEASLSKKRRVMPPGASAAIDRKSRQAAKQAFQERQFNFFDDLPGAMVVLRLAESSEAQVATALTLNPDILAINESDTSAIQAQETLQFAHFMRTTGTPEADVAASLTEAGANVSEVLAQLAKVEAEIGSQYPSDKVIGIEEVDDVDAQDVDLDELESDEETIDGISLEDGDPDGQDILDKASRAANNDSGTSALSQLLRAMRAPKFQPPTPEEEMELAMRIKAGDESAGKELVERNMRFLVMMAKRFRYTGRPLDELISAGAAGLVVATQKFDVTRARFTTCAMFWIRQSIQRWLATDGLLKTPTYMAHKERSLRRSAETSTSDEERAELLNKADALKREIQARRSTHVSLDAGIGDDEDGTLHGILPAVEAGTDDAIDANRIISWMITAAHRELKTMTGTPDVRAREIFLLRTGLHPDHYGDPQSLADIAAIYNVSRERVRQIFSESIHDIIGAVEHYAKGPANLPKNFRESLLSLCKRSGSQSAADDPEQLASRTASAQSDEHAFLDEIFALESAGPVEAKHRAQLASWLVQAAKRELKTEAGKPDPVARDVFLMRVGLHDSSFGAPLTMRQIGRRLGIATRELASIYEDAVEEIAYAVEHYAKGKSNLPSDFRARLLSPKF